MAKKPLPTPDELRQLLCYDPETGKLFWKKRAPEFFKDDGRNGSLSAASSWNSQNAGQEAFITQSGDGYLVGGLFKRLTRAHRVAWAITHGEWPTGEIDHINGDRSDNRITNLRDVSSQENKRNAARRCDNKSGAVGVRFRRDNRKWEARIFTDGGERSLGCFDDFNEAASARKAEEVRLGYHPNHGR